MNSLLTTCHLLHLISGDPNVTFLLTTNYPPRTTQYLPFPTHHLLLLNEALSAGVVLLRVTPVTVEGVHQELDRLFQEHAEEDLRGLFCVVEPNRHRIRKTPMGNPTNPMNAEPHGPG